MSCRTVDEARGAKHGRTVWGSKSRSGMDAASPTCATARRGEPRLRGALRLHFHRLRDRQDGGGDAGDCSRGGCDTTGATSCGSRPTEQRKITRLRLVKLRRRAPDTMMITDTCARHRARRAGGRHHRHPRDAPGERVDADRPRHDRRATAAGDADRGRPLVAGTYRLTFDIGAYHRSQGTAGPFFPEVKITFNVRDPDEHYSTCRCCSARSATRPTGDVT